MQGGEKYRAGRFVFACGPWLPKLFPDLLGRRIFPTRQEVFFFAPDGRRRPLRARRACPAGPTSTPATSIYGFPDLEGRGFKIAHDPHGPPIDPDAGDRTPSPAALAEVRAYMEPPLPGLRGAPLNEARVCQYENSANGDLLIDCPSAPAQRRSWSAPARATASSTAPPSAPMPPGCVTGTLAAPEPRFSLATKGERQDRAVH